MKSEELKMAQIEERTHYIDVLVKLLTHPVPLAIFGYYLSDRLQGDYVKRNLIQDTEYSEEEQRYIVVRESYDKVWDPTAGKLNGGAAFAMQTGLTAYLGAEALKQIAGAIK